MKDKQKIVENEKLGYLGYLGFLAFLALPLGTPVLLAFFGFFFFFFAFRMSKPTKMALFSAVAAVIPIVAHNVFSGLFGESSVLSGLFFTIALIFLFAIPVFLIWRVSLCFKEKP